MDFSDAVLLLKNGRRVSRPRLHRDRNSDPDAQFYLYVVNGVLARCRLQTVVEDHDHTVTREDIHATDWEEFYQGYIPSQLSEAIGLLRQMAVGSPPRISWNNQVLCKFCGSPVTGECRQEGCVLGKVLVFLGIKSSRDIPLPPIHRDVCDKGNTTEGNETEDGGEDEKDDE